MEVNKKGGRNMYDVVIIGSGPAGLSASIYGRRANLEVLVVEKQAYSGGQIINTEQVDNYLGLFGVNGVELAQKFRKHADDMGVKFQQGTVERIVNNGQERTVVLSEGEALKTKTILVATGAKYRRLQVPGEEQFHGHGVSYCATCDGAFFANQEVMVVGGGNVALEDALYLSKVCKKVYLVHRSKELRAAKQLQEKMREKENIEFLAEYEVEEIVGTEKVEAVYLKGTKDGNHREVAVTGIFVAIGMEPESHFAQKVVHCNEDGYIIANESCRTNEEGIYVAGDVRTKELRQLVTAVSDGANAMVSIENYLYHQEGNSKESKK